ncbi:MAG: hypothetical protein QNJ49_00480 [Mastigocoleus sp. MO_167.B18]|uniref:hypothetical protein n=1 Tax=Mastigocoleus sp. MO_188.B34 TaxID=3036635 RepID=UPI00262AFCBC|nr:hypothetical protein [Mastigocoleus sp. MO_188.B34]MDJ0771894.1 hypothetical protein [Mastigocoleus sp. MO_167.B18]
MLRLYRKESGVRSQKELPITNYQLPITHYQLPITHYPLLTQKCYHKQKLRY